MADIAELIVALRLQDGVSAGLGNLNRTLNDNQAALAQMGRGVGQVGQGLSRLATIGTVAAVGGLTAVITIAASFEQAFTGVEKTVEATEAQFRELEETIRGMARTGLGTFEDLAATGEAGGALGIAREDLDEFIDVVSRLGVSTDLSTEAAATALGQLANVLHLSGEDMEEFADSLVALGNAGASTESQIVEMAARFGAAGNSAGLSKEEILALSSAVASMGIEVEAGGSALSRIFNNIATDIGTGSDHINSFTRVMGISSREFKQRWTDDALGTLQEFLAELSKLDQFEAARVLEEAGITNVRDINAVKLMSQNLGFFAEQLGVAEDAQGALREESDKFLATTEGMWFTFQQNARDALATIGEELLPLVNEQMSEFIGWLNKASTQKGIKDFATDLATGVKDLVSAVRGADFSGLIGTMKGAAEIAKGAFHAFRALPEPIQQLAIAALVANRVTGGAVGSIAAGLSNILMGSLKLAFSRGETPLRPMYVSQVGGLPGAGGSSGGTGVMGLLGPLGLAIAGLSTLAVVGEQVYQSVNPLGYEFNQLASQLGRTRQQIEGDVNSLAQGTGRSSESIRAEMIPMLKAGMGWDEIVRAIESSGSLTYHELVTLRDTVQRGNGGISDRLGQALASQQAGRAEGVAGFNKVTNAGLLVKAALPNTAVMEGGARATAATLPSMQAIAAQSAANLLGLNARTDSLVGIGQTGNTRLWAIENKNWTPTINVTPTINTNVHIDGASVLRATSRLLISTNSGGI